MNESVLIIAGAIIVAVILLVIGFFFTRPSTEEQMITRLEKQDTDAIAASEFTNKPKRDEDLLEGGLPDDEERSLLDPFNNYLANRTFGQSWQQKLARADLKLTVAEFFVLHFVAMGIAFFIGYLIFQGDIVFSVVLAFIGFFFPRIYVGRRVNGRLHRFEQQLPDTIQLWTSALRAGYSPQQAMEAIAREAAEPTKSEFFRVVQENQIGIDFPDALNHLLERMNSEDLDLVITAVNINREVGGNLAEILEVIATTIRERIKLKGEIRVLTSQGRFTGWMISLLPIGLALFLNAMNPGYMGQLFDDRLCGWPLLGIGLGLIGMGAAMIQKIVDIDI
ncbi:type II secretion system F family protein [Anaerolineales bacterium]|jgi:tight adherence protein B